MKKLFDEYGTLMLSFVCSTIGFDFLFKTMMNGEYIHNIINHLLYGTL